MSWPLIKLGNLVSVKGGKRLPAGAEYSDEITDHPYVRVCDMGQGGLKTADSQLKYISDEVFEGIKRYTISSDDVYISIAGTIGVVGAIPPRLNGANLTENAAKLVIKDASVLNKEFLIRFLSTKGKRDIEAKTKATSQPKLALFRIEELEIPLPPLPEQKRIAAILDKADDIRRKRQQAIQLADDFLRAVFLDMFGDPVTNPKGWETESLEGLVKVISGATPSKSNEVYWSGDFPWVSPKDMKSVEISSSIDHINQIVFERENLKKLPVGAVLIVVRGMILVHTVPIGIATAEVAINQDIKAFVSLGRVLPEFLLWFLLSQHANLLSKVTTAAHGTKRFDMVDLLNMPVFLPDTGLQEKFVNIVRSYKAALDGLDWSHKCALELFDSLGQRAFAGEL